MRRIVEAAVSQERNRLDAVPGKVQRDDRTGDHAKALERSCAAAREPPRPPRFGRSAKTALHGPPHTHHRAMPPTITAQRHTLTEVASAHVRRGSLFRPVRVRHIRYRRSMPRESTVSAPLTVNASVICN